MGLLGYRANRAAGCWTLVPNASIPESIFIWSVFTLLQGFVVIFDWFRHYCPLALRFWLVWRECLASFPGNSSALLQHGLAGERRWPSLTPRNTLCHGYFRWNYGLADARSGLVACLLLYGRVGIIISFIWLKVIHEPNNHPVNKKLEVHRRRRRADQYGSERRKAKSTVSVKWGFRSNSCRALV